MPGEKPDMVNRPPHYQTPGGIEVIDFIESCDFNFSRGNAVKYIARAGVKGGIRQEIVDLDKAIWYLTRESNRLKADGRLKENKKVSKVQARKRTR